MPPAFISPASSGSSSCVLLHPSATPSEWLPWFLWPFPCSLLRAVSTLWKAVTTSTALCWDHKWFWIRKLQNYCNPCVLDSSVQSSWEICGKGLSILPECSGEWIKRPCAKRNG